MAVKISGNTVLADTPPSIAGWSSVVGEKEGDGPLGDCFDEVCGDGYFGQKTWEQAESEMLRRAVRHALRKGNFKEEDIDFAFAGDLQNQCTATTFAFLGTEIPLFGLYGACSTMSEALVLGTLLADSGIGKNILCAASSHFSTAERQFRFPLSYGGVRTPTAQWTCTAAGAAVLSSPKSPPYIKGVSVGKITDLGVSDANNMGAAMAPAAAFVISSYLRDTGLSPSDFDCILTGDLGRVGGSLVKTLLKSDGIDIAKQYKDCGTMIFNLTEQDVHAGASGCGCSASVLCGYFLDKVKSGELKNILFCATGALMSGTSSQQGENIPSISHAVHISCDALPLSVKNKEGTS